MRTVVLSSIVLSMFLASCGSSTSSTAYQDPHSRAHSKMHNELYQEEIQKELNQQIDIFVGEYYGTIPCSDCDGIEMQLELFQDMTFTGSVKYVGKSDENQNIEGDFSLKANGIVALDKALGGMVYFQKKDADLIILDQNAKEIISVMNETYVLKQSEPKKVKAFESDDPKVLFLKKKWDEGIVFYANGHNASWALDLKQSDSLIFKAPDGVTYKFLLTKALPSIDPTIIEYRTYSDKAEIMLQLVQKQCEDTSHGNKLSFQVNVTFKHEDDKEPKTFQGCGAFIPDYNLTGKWKIIEVDGIPIDENSFPNQKPYLVLDPFNGTISGNDGCNGFFGQITNKMNQLSFGPTGGTLMACENMNLSAKLMGLISEKTMTYQVTNELTLNTGNKKVMVLRRDD